MQGVEQLRTAMRGTALTPADNGYNAGRAIFNGMIDRRPAVIAQCDGVADVMRSLDFAVTRSLPVSVRCGGHSLPGYGVCEGGVMIDLERMHQVYVDPSTKTARAQGGTNWGQFDHETQAFGLATTGGLVRSTGIGGLTLAGGHGFLMRKYGLACDNLISADVLTASGTLIKASATENPDLFWALRGGGGNFGIVTSFEYRLHDVGAVLGGVLLAPFSEAMAQLRFYDSFSVHAPEELGVLAALATLPDGTKAVVHLACYCGDTVKGEEVLRPLRTRCTPIADQIQAMPYAAVQSIVENFNPRGMRNYWKMVYVNELNDDAIATLTDHYSKVPAPLTHIVVYSFGGRVAAVPDADTAVSFRQSRHAVIAIGMWEDPADDARVTDWVRQFATKMQPYASAGFYPNYEANAEGGAIAAAFGEEKYQRLVAIKRQYDPGNVFRLNQNIVP
ncbi:MAG: FAD-binding oxidoreductase [Bryobacterales bacterium]|nr:FAD-binding oxidoreductase [Bryobacterales bacterium]